MREPGLWDGAGTSSPQLVAHSPRGQRAERLLPALLHPWKVDGNIPGFAPAGHRSSTAPFQLCSLPDSLGRIPWAKGSPAPDRQGREDAPALGRWENMDGDEGWHRWMKDRAAHTRPPAAGGQFLICSAPCPPKVMGKVLPGPQHRTNLPSAPRAPRQTPDLDPSGCAFPFVSLQPDREQNPCNYHNIRWEKCHFTPTCSRMELKGIRNLQPKAQPRFWHSSAQTTTPKPTLLPPQTQQNPRASTAQG